jgi:hypothetical protein
MALDWSAYVKIERLHDDLFARRRQVYEKPPAGEKQSAGVSEGQGNRRAASHCASRHRRLIASMMTCGSLN